MTVEANSLDFEIAQRYRFNVTARDNGDIPLTDEVEVEITVLDLNDNNPVFYPDNRYTASVDEGNYTAVSSQILLVSQEAKSLSCMRIERPVVVSGECLGYGLN